MSVADEPMSQSDIEALIAAAAGGGEDVEEAEVVAEAEALTPASASSGPGEALSEDAIAAILAAGEGSPSTSVASVAVQAIGPVATESVSSDEPLVESVEFDQLPAVE